MEDVFISDQVDVAIGHVVGVESVLGIRPMGRYPLAGEDLLVVEYSRSTAVDETTGGLGFADPEIWKGYVVRSYKSDMPPHPRPTYCYELSVPAVAGASGAPVISVDDHTLAGMVVANVGRELMPASVERLERTDGATEEVRFYLPHAEAIAWTELIQALPEGVPHPWAREDARAEQPGSD